MATLTITSTGASTAISLDSISKSNSISFIGNASSGSAVVQATVNNPMTETVSWVDISSAVSSTNASGLFLTVLSPLYAVRANVSSGVAGFSYALSVAQSDPV